MNFYVLCADKMSNNLPARVRMVGPFADRAAAGRHFSTYEGGAEVANPNNPGDNPMWQVVEVATPHVFVVDPVDAKME